MKEASRGGAVAGAGGGSTGELRGGNRVRARAGSKEGARGRSWEDLVILPSQARARRLLFILIYHKFILLSHHMSHYKYW